ncbi:hypothetical protein EHQ55_02790 [Leptospira meyeri]|uniref:hypothetical protein n=1 Tax=Leptospira meyeri TaxID=29508 RepID=UPI001082D22D|nr:hypothetical protein [Leptospira meyeri]TGL52845.1 hypothetical protein EHQ55_02790 [Leptospira meyeri]
MIQKYIIIALLCSNCVSVQVNSDDDTNLSVESITMIEGKLIYKGNPEYIPRMIKNSPSSNEIINYDYTISYEPTDPSDFAVVLNPLLTFGFPIEKHKVILNGTLKYNNGNESISSKVIVSQYRTLYNNPNYSEMRRLGLFKLKTNIETKYQNNLICDEKNR